LQQDHGGKFVYRRFTPAVGNAGAAQCAFGFLAGPALIAKFNRQAGFALQFAGEFAGVIALPAGIAAHVQRVSHQNFRHAAKSREFAQIFDIVSPPAAFESIETLCGNPQFIADGEADPLLPEIERQYSSHHSIVLTHYTGFKVMATGIRNSKGSLLESARESNYALMIIATGVVIAILYWARAVFVTSLVALIVAFLLEPFVELLTRVRFPRPLATFMVCLFAVVVLYLAGLMLWNQLSDIARVAPNFAGNLAAKVSAATNKLQDFGDSATRILGGGAPAGATSASGVNGANGAKPAPHAAPKNGKKTVTLETIPALPGAAIQEVRIHEDHNAISTYIVASLGTLYQFVLMASFVPFLVYFMLSWRDHIYKSFLRFFEGADRLVVARSVSGVSAMARAFVVGNFFIGVILAMLSSALFAVIHVPSPVLLGILSGFLSLTPYIGFPLGMMPPLFGALATDADSGVILLSVVVVLTLHLTAMNVFYPKLVGARVHLNPLVVTLSLMFWGFLWDAAGLLLAIPITAGIKAICDNVAALKPYGRFLGD
jgi:predicted PurR-regulated permease PerM